MQPAIRAREAGERAESGRASGPGGVGWSVAMQAPRAWCLSARVRERDERAHTHTLAPLALCACGPAQSTRRPGSPRSSAPRLPSMTARSSACPSLLPSCSCPTGEQHGVWQWWWWHMACGTRAHAWRCARISTCCRQGEQGRGAGRRRRQRAPGAATQRLAKWPTAPPRLTMKIRHSCMRHLGTYIKL